MWVSVSFPVAAAAWMGALGVGAWAMAHNPEAAGGSRAPTPETLTAAALRRAFPTPQARAERLEDLMALPAHSVTWHRSAAFGVLGALSCVLLLTFRETRLGSSSPLAVVMLLLVALLALMGAHFVMNAWMHARVLQPHAAESLALWHVVSTDDLRRPPASSASSLRTQTMASPLRKHEDDSDREHDDTLVLETVHMEQVAPEELQSWLPPCVDATSPPAADMACTAVNR